MKLIPIILSATAILCAVSCAQEHPDNFLDINSVYFNNRVAGNVLTDSTDVTFVYSTEDDMEIAVAVQLLGRAADYDRPVAISVRSENAVQDRDYSLPSEAVLPAGEYSFNYRVVLHNSAALQSEKKEIKLELEENEHFTLDLAELAQTAGTVSTLSYRILFSDMFTSAPAAWNESILGAFSQGKFELICKVLSHRIQPDDFNDESVITMAMLMYIYAEITAYISEQEALMVAGEEFDGDIIDPETGDVWVFPA